MSVPVEERFWSKVTMIPEHSCWEWTGCRIRNGYGQIKAGPRLAYAHRFAYELLCGPIPAGLTLDHLCRNRGCVNPAHLEPVTMRENCLRGISFSAANARKTHCPQGHPYDVEDNNGARRCLVCRRVGTRNSMRRFYAEAGLVKAVIGMAYFYASA